MVELVCIDVDGTLVGRAGTARFEVGHVDEDGLVEALALALSL